MNKEELQKVLENHKHWLNKDVDRWKDMKANLRGANLNGADLNGANLYMADLHDANLHDANLNGADLNGANLNDANLHDANLNGADLNGANLNDANLHDANLNGANLNGANLCGADLHGANLCGANLYGANLRRANLCGANLYGANLLRANLRWALNIPYIPYACPETGSFIGYKKANNMIVELEIISDAKRCSGTGRKCRCSKAKVLSIQNIDGSISELTEIASNYDNSFIYKVGEIAEVDNFCEDRWEECSEGIHFFINRKEAVDYR